MPRHYLPKLLYILSLAIRYSNGSIALNVSNIATSTSHSPLSDSSPTFPGNPFHSRPTISLATFSLEWRRSPQCTLSLKSKYSKEGKPWDEKIGITTLTAPSPGVTTITVTRESRTPEDKWARYIEITLIGPTTTVFTAKDHFLLQSSSFGACCGFCSIYAPSGVEVKYWPKSSTPNQTERLEFSSLKTQQFVPHTPEATYVVDEEGATFYSPSMYLVYQTLEAFDGCGPRPEKKYNVTLSFLPHEVSSRANYYETQWRRPLDFDHIHCETIKTISAAGTSSTYCEIVIAPYSKLFEVDPSFASCWDNGIYDPPQALESQAELITPPQALPTQDPAEPQATISTGPLRTQPGSSIVQSKPSQESASPGIALPPVTSIPTQTALRRSSPVAVVVGSMTISLLPSAVLIASKTVIASGTAVIISSKTVSLDPSGTALILDGSTLHLPSKLSADPSVISGIQVDPTESATGTHTEEDPARPDGSSLSGADSTVEDIGNFILNIWTGKSPSPPVSIVGDLNGTIIWFNGKADRIAVAEVWKLLLIVQAGVSMILYYI